MATNRIKGITIEIDGDTTKLEKALGKLNTEIRNSQSTLKDIDKLLKLDPGNTDLLQQKYRVLGTSVDDTKQKLQSLKEAQEQMDRAIAGGKEVNQDQYDALQREIIETTEKLKQLETEYRNFGTISSQQIAVAGEKMKDLGDKVSSAGEKVMPASVAVMGIGAAAVKTTADFDSSMSNVKAISGATGESFDALRDKAIEMGGKTVFSASESADAMSYMAMAGWKTQDMLDGIDGIMNLAAASGEDLATTSDIVTDALTAFGLSAESSSRLADILAAASSNANTNVAMMGESFQYAAPLMGSMNYSAEDTALALGLMANSGIKASMAGTSLRSIITRIAKPTKESATAMENLGLSISDSEGNMYSFREIMQQIRDGFGDLKISQDEYKTKVEELDAALADGTMTEEEYNEEMEKFAEAAFGAEGAMIAQNAAMLAGKQGMSGLLAIVSASDEDFNKLADAIDNSEGSAKQMADTMVDNLGGDIKILKSTLETLAISIGDLLMPTIRDIVGHVQNFVNWLNGLDEGTKNVIVKAGLFVAALGPLLIIVGKVMSGIGSIMTMAPKIAGALGTLKGGFGGLSGLLGGLKGGLGALGGALGSLAGPIAIIIAVVAALAAAFIHLWNTNDNFKSKIIEIWDGIKEKFSGAFEKITEAINSLGFDFENLGEIIKAAWDWICNALAPIIVGVFDMIGQTLGGVIDVVAGIVQVICGIIQGFKDGDWSLFLDGLQTLFMGFIELITAPFHAAFETFKGYLESFGTTWDEVWEGIKDFFIGIWESIKEGFSSACDSIKGVWDKVTDVVSSTWETIKNIVQVGIQFIGQLIQLGFDIITLPFRFIWENCKEYIIEAWETITGKVQAALDFISEIISNVWNGIVEFLSPILENIKNIITSAWEMAKNIVTMALDFINNTITTIWNSIVAFLSPILEGIRNLFDTIFNAIKTIVTNIFNSILTVIANTIKNVKAKIASGLNDAKSTVTEILDKIKQKFSDIFENVKSIVKNGIEKIKSFFNFTWSLPKLKLPHFTISGSFSLNPPSAPSFGIEWYKKAMNDGMILTSPTIFGAAGGNLLGGGEAGPEAVVGVDSLRTMVKDAVLSAAPAGCGNITIPVYIGQRKIETVVVDAINRNNFRSGGRS